MRIHLSCYYQFSHLQGHALRVHDMFPRLQQSLCGKHTPTVTKTCSHNVVTIIVTDSDVCHSGRAWLKKHISAVHEKITNIVLVFVNLPCRCMDLELAVHYRAWVFSNYSQMTDKSIFVYVVIVPMLIIMIS